ncbi:MAG: ethanolamine utilization protein EutH [Ruminococcaceae bacterium]|nr:ethanolamine utilization protein EutH [Oscillospiraceae bacterium]
MLVIKIVILIFAALGALDYILGNRFDIGKEFVNGIMLMGTMLLSMQGMLVISPLLADLLEPVFGFVHDTLHMDPSIIPASLFANDMGGAPLAKEIMTDPKIGMFNALVVSSMMGCTISFTIPFALGLVPKEQHKNLLLGLLCGIVTIPAGCFVGGLVCGIAFLPLILNLLPLILLSALIAFGLLKFPGVCVKIFAVLGFAMKALIIVGLVFGMAHFLTGFALFPEIGDAWDEGIRVCTNAAVFLAGAFPLVFVVSRLLHRPLRLLGRALRINETSALCLLSSLASSSATFGMMKSMDERGAVLNAAFAVSGAFVFAGHLAFTVAFDPAYVPAVVVGKLVGGVLALLLAIFISSRTLTTKEETEA